MRSHNFHEQEKLQKKIENNFFLQQEKQMMV